MSPGSDASSAGPPADPAASASVPAVTESASGSTRTEPDWGALTARSLEELKQAPEHYRPTNFWDPGLDRLLGDMDRLGLENFKSWPESGLWFYPLYVRGNRLPEDGSLQTAGSTNAAGVTWDQVAGLHQARRDFDVARVAWDRQRWPFEPRKFGESTLGNPPQSYQLLPRHRDKTYGRAYLNYLLCLAALSRHVDAPPKSFLEIGGGYGSLGEIVLAHDPDARYVDLDIPPLLTVASWYLHHLFPERSLSFLDDVPASGPFTVGGSAVLPNYRIEDLQDEFDVFVNTFSFQEMEPDVVQRYIDQVCAKGVKYVVSLNSLHGKRKAAAEGDTWAALDPVRTTDIVRWFSERGFELVGEYTNPMVRSAAKLVVLERVDAVPTTRLFTRARRKLGRRLAR